MQSSRPTSACEVPSESSRPREGKGYNIKAVYSIDASIDANIPRRKFGVLLMRNVNKTDSLQSSGCNLSLVISCLSVSLSVCVTQFFSAPSRPTLASEVPGKSS